MGHGKSRYTGINGKHTIDTTGLDLDETTMYWKTEDVGLGKLMTNGQLQHVPKEEVVYLDTTPRRCKAKSAGNEVTPLLPGRNMLGKKCTTRVSNTLTRRRTSLCVSTAGLAGYTNPGSTIAQRLNNNKNTISTTI